jgi:predicted nucleic acid-binding protein
MYVETDFLMALAKPEDWLADRVEETLASHDVHTSVLAYVEFLMHAYEPDEGIGFDVPRVVADLLESVPIRPEPHEDAALAAAWFLDEHDMTPFDAFHAGMAVTEDVPIHSSDQAFEDVAIERVPLEPNE